MNKEENNCGNDCLCGKRVTLDPNVLSIMEKHKSRAEKGMEKYGVDTTRRDLSYRDWLVHHQEELMDAAIYVERAMQSAALFERMREVLQDLVEKLEDDGWPSCLAFHHAQEILKEAEALTPEKEKVK